VFLRDRRLSRPGRGALASVISVLSLWEGYGYDWWPDAKCCLQKEKRPRRSRDAICTCTKKSVLGNTGTLNVTLKKNVLGGAGTLNVAVQKKRPR
jgi:hypothetical protein